jgi:hypothetical protein
MATTPQINLVAKTHSIIGDDEISGWLRVTLCGYGQVDPKVPGVCNLADAGVPQLIPEAPSGIDGAGVYVQLFGNDVIDPAGTYYEVAVLDQNRNVVQANAYRFIGSGDFDLSNQVPIVPPYGFPVGDLNYQPCTQTGAFTFTSPGPVIAVSYNGILLPRDVSFPTNSYSLAVDQITITLNFSVESLDRIDALCIL